MFCNHRHAPVHSKIAVMPSSRKYREDSVPAATLRELQALARAWRAAGSRGGLAAGAAHHAADGILTLAEQRLLISTAFTALVDFAGIYSVQALANALACHGGEPQSLWATLLLPADQNPAAEQNPLGQEISSLARKLNVSWRGEQSRCLPGMREPLVACQMLALLAAQQPCLPQSIQAGDHLILTKDLAGAAAALMANAKEEELSEAFDLKFARRCQQLAAATQASVLAEARCAWNVNGIHALRDLFQAGLAGVLHDMMDYATLDFEINLAEIEILPEAKLLCDYFGVDPLAVFAPGALVIVGEPGGCEAVLGKLRLANIPAKRIGQVLKAGEGRWLVEGGERVKLPRPARDPLVAILS